MMDEAKIVIKHCFRRYHNEDITRFLDTVEDRESAIKTLDFLKQTYPEIADVIRGELQEEQWV